MCHALAWLAVSAGTLSSLFLAWSVRRHPEKMGVMNWVWPLVGLPGGPLAVWLYLRHRRPGPTPAWLSIATATCHCGAGCTLGDILSEGGLCGQLSGEWVAAEIRTEGKDVTGAARRRPG
jgi:hypothetical protein